MPFYSSVLTRPYPALFAALIGLHGLKAQSIVINEVSATQSDRVLRFNAAGNSFLGCDTPWYSVDFQKTTAWRTGAGPFGFGSGYTVGTNVQAEVYPKALSFYLRREFTLTAGQAATVDPLQLQIDYDDGFVAYLNGVEIARRNLGPSGAFVYHDQQSFNTHPAGTAETIQVASNASSLLRTGANVLAIQVHNNALAEGLQDAPATAPGANKMRCAATLSTTGASPQTFVTQGDPYFYVPGVHEPSGGLLDPADFPATSTLPLGPNWTQADYADGSWPTVNGALGFENDPNGDYLDQIGTNSNNILKPLILNLRLAIYGRREFSLSQAEYDGITTLSLGTDWDDGYVLFLNGREIDRRNLTGNAGSIVPFNTAASGHGGSRDGGNRALPVTYQNVAVPKALLRVGKNVLSAQIHNASTGSSDLLLDVQFTAAGTAPLTFVTRDSVWRYNVPAAEIAAPVPADAVPTPRFYDWIELRNTTAAPVDLGGWSLTDVASTPGKWSFPAGTSIAANGYLVVACSGKDIRTPGTLMHTNFSLGSQGEYLALTDAGGTLVSSVSGTPDQDYFHTWGIDPGSGQYRFLSHATPGLPNDGGTDATAKADGVDFDKDTGYYPTPITVALTSNTPGSTIRYTLDGSEPTESNGTVYAGPFDPTNKPGIGPGTGSALREVWNNVPYGINNIPARPADLATYIEGIDHPGGGDNYSSKISGFLHPPATGSYSFWIASDDESRFYLSTNDQAGNKVLKCSITGWTAYHDWTAQKQNYGGTAGDTSPQEPNQATTVPTTLTEGQKYWFEVYQSEGGGGDHVSVGWTGPGIATITPIAGRYLSPPPTVPAGVTPPPKSAVVRARSFAPGHLASDVKTRNYAVGFAPAYSSISSVFLAGDGGRTFFLPNGVFSINGGSYNTEGSWVPGNPGTDYNFCLMHGEPFERPAAFEVIRPGSAAPLVRTDVGIRFAGSPWSRPRYRNLNLEAGTWTTGFDPHNKPQINVHFRDDIGQNNLSLDGFIPGSEVDKWDTLRLRAGKNDAFNPLIVDEFMRRSFRSMGKNPAPLGFFANLFVNGSWKGLFNPTERPRESFFQEYLGTKNGFDTDYIGSFEDGDNIAFNTMWTFFGANDFSVLANYEAGKTHWDEVNVADYLVLHGWGATQDFPHNNFVLCHERAPAGKWRFSMWDAEASFNLWGQVQDYDEFLNVFGLNDLTNSGVAAEGGHVRRVVRRFAQSPEFRMLVADRIQKHFYNGGAMTAASLTARYNDLKNQVSAVILAGYQQTFNDSFWTTWINGGTGRITPFLTQARAYGLWPTTQAPIVSPFGGTIGTGSSVTLVNPNGVGTLYYTTNGTDPRAPGGGIQGSTYSGAIAIPQPVTLKARVRSTTGEWSPLAEADFAPPPARILFTELNYNPPGSGDDTEFLELANVGGVVASLNGAHFTEGIDYTFGNITLNPGQRIVLVSNPAAFSTAYPGVTVGGTYAGNLSNSGETVTLRDIAEAVICTVTYGDSNAAGWPADPDGEGSSLVLKRPSALLSAAALNDPASWRRSAQPNPAGIDGIALTAPDPLADADKDGFSALVEYVAGTSDADGAAGPGLTISLDASGYTLVSLTHPAGTDDAMLEAFESTALGGWTAMPLVEESWNGPAGTVTSTWRCAQPTAANQRTFLRLKATRL